MTHSPPTHVSLKFCPECGRTCKFGLLGISGSHLRDPLNASAGRCGGKVETLRYDFADQPASPQPPRSRREEAELDGGTTGGQHRVGDPVSSRRQGEEFLDKLGPREGGEAVSFPAASGPPTAPSGVGQVSRGTDSATSAPSSREETVGDPPPAGAVSSGGQGCEHCSCAIHGGAACCHCEYAPRPTAGARS